MAKYKEDNNGKWLTEDGICFLLVTPSETFKKEQKEAEDLRKLKPL